MGHDPEVAHKVLDPKGKKAYLLLKSTTPNFMALPLEYQGFCPYTLASQGGLLVQGSPEIGIVTFKGSFYTLRGGEEITAFAKDPEKIVSKIKTIVSKKPHYAHLLQVQEEIPNFALPVFLEIS